MKTVKNGLVVKRLEVLIKWHVPTKEPYPHYQTTYHKANQKWKD